MTTRPKNWGNRDLAFQRIRNAIFYWEDGTLAERTMKARVRAALETYAGCNCVNRRGELKIAIGYKWNDKVIWERICYWKAVPTVDSDAGASAEYVLDLVDIILDEFEINPSWHCF